ncbi:cytochrome P450, partial [Armillaria solidipes]
PGPFPPGPKGLSFIGNDLDIPSEKEWLTFARWGEKYGHIASVSVLGRRIVVINSAQTAIDILDKKGAIYSDRPIVAMGRELVGWKNAFVLMPYGSRFRVSRRRVHQIFGTNTSFKQFLPVISFEISRSKQCSFIIAATLIADALRMNVANIMQISYGYEIQEESDPFLKLADEAADHFIQSTTPGAFLVNILPILRHIPDWFPRAEFKRTAKEWRSTLHEVVEQPYNYAKQQIAAGDARYSFTSSQLKCGMSNDKEFDIRWTAAALYTGQFNNNHLHARNTTAGSGTASFSLPTSNSAKAQAEIDVIVGNDGLPRFDDREHLPYINALALEVNRWHAVGLLYSVSEDDVQSGYFIPANVWYENLHPLIPRLMIIVCRNMLHDRAVYHKPFEWRPWNKEWGYSVRHVSTTARSASRTDLTVLRF